MDRNLIAKQLKSVTHLGIAAFALCALAWPAIADPPTISRKPDLADPVSGSCKAFVQATVRGVRDIEGIVHTGACGFTRFRPLFNNLDQADFLDAVLKELFDPPFKVESFAGDVSKDAGRFCARAFNFAIDLGAEVQVLMLDWHHGKKPDSECAKEWQRLKRVIRNHEEKHARDVKPVLDAAAARLRQLNPISCAASNKDAVDGLEPVIVTALNAWFKSIKDDWDARQSSLDNSGADQCVIDCSKCNKRKLSFRGVTIDCIIRRPTCSVRMGQELAGSVCGDPVAATWTITPHYFVEGCGSPTSSTRYDKPFDSDCVQAGSEEERRRVSIYTNSRGIGGGGWMCVYSEDPQPKITIRSFQLSTCEGASEQTITVDAEVSQDCDESSQPPAPPSPATLRPNS